MPYVIEIQPNCWLADWDGDPGRTTKIENARQYKSELDAKLKLERVIEKFGVKRNFSLASVNKV